MPENLIPQSADIEYLVRRESQSRAAAAASADPAARMAHKTMAKTYADQLKRA